jgi:hypothetical protein
MNNNIVLPVSIPLVVSSNTTLPNECDINSSVGFRFPVKSENGNANAKANVHGGFRGAGKKVL